MSIFTTQFLFSPEGRINRQPLWLFILFYFVTLVAAGIIDQLVGANGILSLIVTVPLVYMAIIVQIKRWHDRDKVGWWVLINLIPLVGAIWVLIECGFLRGTPGPNRFGEDPLAGSAA